MNLQFRAPIGSWLAIFIIFLLVSCTQEDEVRDSRYFPTGTVSGESSEGTKLNKVNLWNHPTRRSSVNATVEAGEKVYIIQETDNHYWVGKPGTSQDGWLNKEFIVDIKPPVMEREIKEGA